jgi:hypothetical protein
MHSGCKSTPYPEKAKRKMQEFLYFYKMRAIVEPADLPLAIRENHISSGRRHARDADMGLAL